MRQLIKFCVVGATSTVVDLGIYRFLLFAFPLLPWWISQSISFCFGVTNGFIWNRKWTFQASKKGQGAAQYSKFVASNIIGLILNLAVSKGVLFLLTGELVHGVNPAPNQLMLAKILAIPIVLVWNFSAARFWTFKPQKIEFTPELAAEHPLETGEVPAPIASRKA